eukprot:1354255-Amphidinium_carterae.2
MLCHVALDVFTRRLSCWQHVTGNFRTRASSQEQTRIGDIDPMRLHASAAHYMNTSCMWTS